LSGGFGSPFANALAAAAPAAGQALRAAGAAAEDPHAAAMALATSAAEATAQQALAAAVPEAGAALAVARQAAAGIRTASDAVAAVSALAPAIGSPAPASPATGAAATASAAAGTGLAAVSSAFSPVQSAADAAVAPCAAVPDPAATELTWPPNRGFDGEPVMQTLPAGTQLSRYGGWIDDAGQFQDKGTFVAPAEVPYGARALWPGTDKKPLSTYEVVKPIEQVPSGPALPWFGEVGGGTQHDLPASINDLLASGHLRMISRTIPG
jgi:hypothetical protein